MLRPEGIVSNFCAEPAESAAKRVESMGRGSDLTGVDEAVAALEAEAERLKTALAQLLQSMQT